MTKPTKYPPGYLSFIAARARCRNPKNNRYKYYGARGIQFNFNSLEEFIACVGPPFPGASIERININGHYEPGNVKWIPKRLQSRNRSITKINPRIASQIRKEYKKYSKNHTQQALADKYGIDRSTVGYIVRGVLWEK